MFGDFDELFVNVKEEYIKHQELMSPCWRCGSNNTYMKLIAFCEPELYSPRCLDCGAMLDPEFYESFDEAENMWNDTF